MWIRSLKSRSHRNSSIWRLMVSHPGQKWTSNEVGDSVVLSRLRSNLPENKKYTTSGPSRSNSLMSHSRRQSQSLIKMSSHRVLSLCHACRIPCSITFKRGCIMTHYGKASKLYSPMPQCQVKVSIRFWILSDLKGHSLATNLILVTVYMELMPTWLCLVWVLMSRIST